MPTSLPDGACGAGFLRISPCHCRLTCRAVRKPRFRWNSEAPGSPPATWGVVGVGQPPSPSDEQEGGPLGPHRSGEAACPGLDVRPNRAHHPHRRLTRADVPRPAAAELPCGRSAGVGGKSASSGARTRRNAPVTLIVSRPTRSNATRRCVRRSGEGHQLNRPSVEPAVGKAGQSGIQRLPARSCLGGRLCDPRAVLDHRQHRLIALLGHAQLPQHRPTSSAARQPRTGGQRCQASTETVSTISRAGSVRISYRSSVAPPGPTRPARDILDNPPRRLPTRHCA
jgi:hypothetical protein